MNDARPNATSVVGILTAINAFPDAAGEITYMLSVKPSVNTVALMFTLYG